MFSVTFYKWTFDKMREMIKEVYVDDGWEGFSFMLETLMGRGDSNFESFYNTRYSSARYRYKSIVKLLEKM